MGDVEAAVCVCVCVCVEYIPAIEHTDGLV